ncbi:MAG: SPOR domain-containing protein [Terracidiphilus sp.]
MSGNKDRDWIDVASTLALPVVIAVFGSLYTWHKDRADEAQKRWERDSSYVKFLVSTNEQERNLGLLIITDLQNRGQFSEDLSPVVTAVAARLRPSDPSRDTAVKILSNVPGSSTSQASASINAITPARLVYIQIGHESQRARAMALQDALRKQGFQTPEIEVVPHPTFNTYVRYFVPKTKDQANQINSLMEQMKFSPQVQDFTGGGDSGSDALEVWIGDKEPANTP